MTPWCWLGMLGLYGAAGAAFLGAMRNTPGHELAVRQMNFPRAMEFVIAATWPLMILFAYRAHAEEEEEAL